MKITPAESLLLKERFLDLISKQSFADFYNNNGAFNKYVFGDYVKGTPEYEKNLEEVDAYVDKFVRRLLF